MIEGRGGDYWIMRFGEHAFLHICGLLEFRASGHPVECVVTGGGDSDWNSLSFHQVPTGAERGQNQRWDHVEPVRPGHEVRNGRYAPSLMKLILREREYADLLLAPLRHWRVAVICCCLLRRHLRDKRLIVSRCHLLAGVSTVVCLFLVGVSSSSSLDYTFPHFPLLIITEKLELLIKLNDWSLAPPHLSKTHWIIRPACCWATFWLRAWPWYWPPGIFGDPVLVHGLSM